MVECTAETVEFAHRVARRVSGSQDDVYLSAANLALAGALKKFDPVAHDNFLGYLTNWVRYTVLQVMKKEGRYRRRHTPLSFGPHEATTFDRPDSTNPVNVCEVIENEFNGEDRRILKDFWLKGKPAKDIEMGGGQSERMKQYTMRRLNKRLYNLVSA